jgi:hypothetical protein
MDCNLFLFVCFDFGDLAQNDSLGINSSRKKQGTFQFETCLQVIMVRSLFDDKSRVHRFWKSGITS